MLSEDEYVLELAEASEFFDRKIEHLFQISGICKEINKDEVLKKNKRNILRSM